VESVQVQCLCVVSGEFTFRFSGVKKEKKKKKNKKMIYFHLTARPEELRM
jgi:hypothetical protein